MSVLNNPVLKILTLVYIFNNSCQISLWILIMGTVEAPMPVSTLLSNTLFFAFYSFSCCFVELRPQQNRSNIIVPGCFVKVCNQRPCSLGILGVIVPTHWEGARLFQAIVKATAGTGFHVKHFTFPKITWKFSSLCFVYVSLIPY